MELHTSHPALTVEDGDGVALVSFTGSDLREANVSGLAGELIRLLRESGERRIQLSLGGVEFSSAAGLAGVLALHKAVRAAGGKLTLCDVGSGLYELFALTRLTEVLDVRPAGTPELCLV